MRKLSLAAAILLLSSAWVLAQRPDTQNPTNSSPSASQPGQQPDNSQKQSGMSQASTGGQTVEGCVSGSAGNFTLTDASGTTYQLAGDTSKLSDHVGHQVQVTGDQGGGAGAPSSAASSGAAGGAAGGSNTINVTKVKMISSSCPSK